MASIKYKTEDGYVSIPLNIIGSRVYLEDYDDGEVVPELVDDNAKLGNGIGTCSTSTGTALEVTLANYKLVKNGIVAVTFEYDVPANATLNINNKGAKAIYNEGSAIEADVIKAGKTVMFAYDGTHYVVTSLGGSGDIVFPEFVTINLSQSGGSDSDLIGATVVVTNDDTSTTILSTTWQGSNIKININEGINYTITVGDVSGYAVNYTQSYKAIAFNSRTIVFTYSPDAVNLGLPSGTLWAKGNIIKNGSVYKIGEETNPGAYFSWGNITPHFSSNHSTFSDGYVFSSASYNNSPGSLITLSSYPNEEACFVPSSGYDAVRELLGNPWKTPTSKDYLELCENTTSTFILKNGIYGREFTSKINNKTLFFPASGVAKENGIDVYNQQANYWTSSLHTASNGYTMGFHEGLYPKLNFPRYYGMCIRGVI